tara:strand:+ start:290 stop:1594 length:1305 start_codon:yes stop_codon:yes gene_type:complete
MTINLKNFLSDKKGLSKMGEFQELKGIEGLEISSVSADLYDNGRDDLTLFYFREGAHYACINTSSTILSETINWNQKSNKKSIKALLVNTKNANTFTGDQGIYSLDEISKTLSRCLTLKESKSEGGINETVKIKDILFASTGVIGEKFPVEKINNTIQILVDKLRSEQNKIIWVKTASAIMTTDTRPKLAYEEIVAGSKTIKIAGIAKGSGMIAPNLATMLSFIFTDADIAPNILRSLIKKAAANSFNAISVDSDKSTNDMVAIFSTKKVKLGYNRSIDDPIIQKFEIALKKLCLNLAQQIVADGEGAKKFVIVKVSNAKSVVSAKKISFSIANSPLFKTAIAGEDPNWGRIIMGIGKSGENIDKDKLSIKFGDLMVAEKGKISESYNEEKLKEYMKWDSIKIEVDLNMGSDFFECYTCDFTHDYININADYRS